MAQIKEAIQENFISRQATNYLKGVALILMFAHHFFTFPKWYGDEAFYPWTNYFSAFFNHPLKICVCVFAFLTGYFYFFHKKKTLRYSIKKATDVWIPYAVIFLVFSLFAMVLGKYDYSSPKFFLMELFGLKDKTMIFCWYVIFYMISMMILPFFAKLSKKSSVLAFSISLIIPYFLAFTVADSLKAAPWLVALADNLKWFTCIAMGYIFAKHDIFSSFKKALHTKRALFNILISIVLIIVSMKFRFYSERYDFICAPLFIYGLLEIFYTIKNEKVFKILTIIGKYSLLMWFTHCIFFNPCREYTQPILFAPKNPILVLIWGLFVCLCFSHLIQYPINFLTKLKNKLFKLQ